jgi:hypothetical protein
MDMIPLLTTIISITIFISIIELIRRNRLKEKYSILWLFASVVLILFSLSRESLHYISSLVGVHYPPSFIFLLSFLFLIIINIHLTSVISKLTDNNKTLSQEVALLKEAVAKVTDNR